MSNEMEAAVASSGPATANGRKFKAIYMVEDTGTPGKGRWTRIGAAFENRDGSWAIRLSAVPVMGARVQMRDPFTDEKVSAQQAQNDNTEGQRGAKKSAA